MMTRLNRSNVYSEIIFADSHGKVTSFSLDKHTENGNFVGPSGSVLSLDVHKIAGKSGILACVGLDRFLWLFDMSTRKIVGKIYCKTKMTSVLIIEGTISAATSSSSIKRRLEDASARKTEDEESESVWAKLPEVASVSGSSMKRRRLRVQEPLSAAV